MDWRKTLESLETRLRQLADDGVTHLNLSPDAALAELLARAAEAPAAQPSAAQPPAAQPPAAQPPAEDVLPAEAPSPGPAPSPEPAAPERPASPKSTPAAPDRPVAPAADGSVHPSQFASLPALHLAFRECERCGLCAGRSKVVFGVGHERAKIMFVGEGPGRDEDLQGLPFVGRAGKLLTLGIQALGLTREDVYIANIVKCRPPENRNPHPDEIAACLPILQRQMELIEPKLVVTLGNVPLKTFQPSARGITAARGHPIEYRGWPVLPTYHPAYLLRNPAGIEDWWRDLKTAFEMAYGVAP